MKTMMDDYGNPSAMHQKGVESERYVKEAAGQIAATLKVQEKEIYFTSGGTESNNWALIGTALANRRQGNHIIISSIEHPAVSAPAEFLESQGFEVTRLGVNAQGQISPEELKEAIRPETILVSVMFVNNEIGAVEPIAEIGELIKQVNRKRIFMWMRFRPTESSASFRKRCISICFPRADIRFTDRREPDSYISVKK